MRTMAKAESIRSGMEGCFMGRFNGEFDQALPSSILHCGSLYHPRRPIFLEMGILLSLEGFQVDTLCCSTVASWNISLKDKSDVIDELLVILPHVQF